MWLRGAAGEPGYLTGKDAEAAACDAVAEPVVTGHADMRVVDKIIAAGAGRGRPHPGRRRPGPGAATATMTDDAGPDDDQRRAVTDCRGVSRAADPAGRVPGPQPGPGAVHPRRRCRRCGTPSPGSPSTSSPARPASPAGCAPPCSHPPYNTPSLPLDIGYSDSIPASIRRAVLLRDRGCAWPRCGRPAAWCDVHHLQHKKDGGKTAVTDCVLLCQFHHDVCIHRRGWRLVLHPDGTTTAYGPGRPGAAQPLTTHPPRRVAACGH